MEREFDVVVVGYGPAGLSSASLLGRLGHRVCVLERWPTLYGLPRVATIDGESARIVQAAGDIDRGLANSMPRLRYLLANEAGDVLLDHPWAGDHVCGFPYRISIHQPDIEDAMDEAARAHGVEVNQGWEVLSLAQDASGVTVIAKHRETGEERQVRSKYLIGADGARSTVRSLLDIDCETWPVRNGWLCFDAVRRRTLPNLLGLSPDVRAAVVICAPEGRSRMILPLGNGHVRFNFEGDIDADHSASLNAESAYRLLEEAYGLTAEDLDVYRWVFYPFEGKLAQTWRVGRVFLAGDAAHAMPPFAGQGGCSALRDSANLSWKLDLVLRGVVDDPLLETYEPERTPHARFWVDRSDRMAASIFVRDPEAAAERDEMFLNGRVPPPPPDPVVTTGVLLRERSEAPQLPVGGLGPQGVIRRGADEGRFDDVLDWGFQLICRSRNPAELLSADQVEFLEGIRTVVAGVGPVEGDGVVVDVEGAYGRFFDEHGIEGVLVRPDFVVFGVARALDDVPALVDDLRTALEA